MKTLFRTEPISKDNEAPPLEMPQPTLPGAPFAATSAPSKDNVDPTVVKQIVTDYLTELEAKQKKSAEQKKKEADEKGHRNRNIELRS